MRMAAWHLVLTGVVVAASTIAGAGAGVGARRVEPAAGVTLGVQGRANATPWVAADGRLVAIVWGVAVAEKRSDVLLAVSRDGGATFAAPVRVNRVEGEARLGGELPPRVVLVSRRAAGATTGGAGASGTPGDAGRDPEIVVLWTARGSTTAIQVARSRDGGRTFGVPESLQAPDAVGDRGWPALAADARGVVHAIWLDHRGLTAKKSGHVHGPGSSSSSGSGAGSSAGSGASSGSTARSGAGAASHAGATAGTGAGSASTASSTQATSAASATPTAPTALAAAAAKTASSDGVAMAQRSSLFYASLGDAGGATPARAVERDLAPGVCYCCKTALVAGRDGELFAAWRHVYAGDRRDIAFAASRDGGQTFAAPVRVSADDWEINGCPDDGPAMVVGPDGTVHIVWPTVVGTGDDMEGALFYASTRDGRTFTARQRIPTPDNPKPMHPQIALDAAGQLVVAWDEFVFSGRRVARVRALRVASDGVATFGPVVTLGGRSAADDAQYPLLASSARGLLVVWTRGAQGATMIETRRVAVPAS